MKKRYITNPRYSEKADSSNPDIVNHFVEVNNCFPSGIMLPGLFIFSEILDVISKSKLDVLQEWSYHNGYNVITYFRFNYGTSEVFVKVNKTFMGTLSLFDIPKKKLKKYENDSLLSPSIEILYDFTKGTPTQLIELFSKLQLKTLRKDQSRIHLVCQDDGELYTKVFPLISTKTDFDLDLHYGEGFQKFHDQCLHKIKTTEQGIVLFHSPPGCGKTFYIRRLLKEISVQNKIVLYIPNNMVEYLGTPAFNTFLFSMLESEAEMDNEAVGVSSPNILLVIEDAEKILLKRETSPYSADGVSIILNSTDGILNDLLRIQVIATFNCDLNMIDEAILRPKRLIARREFKKLTIEESMKLIKHLNIKHDVTESMSLADIYALQDEGTDALFPTENKSKKIGF